MKLVVFNGSPRGRKGNTHKMIIELLKGAQEKGASTENILLSSKRIEPCRGCFVCWQSGTNKCRLDDDFYGLVNKFYDSDIVVLATPLHTDNVSSLLKTFIDRMIARIPYYMETDSAGEYRHKSSSYFKKIPKLVIVSNAAFPEQSHFQVISRYFHRYSRSMHTEVIAEIYRGQGIALQSDFQNKYLREEDIQNIENYKQTLYKAGTEIIEHLKIKEETKAKLEKPLLSYEMYVDNFHNFMAYLRANH